jgi:SpoVK/Ycf46/Vps4 family AAA+-type ATPase
LTLNEYEDVLTFSLVKEHEFSVSVIIAEKEQIIKKAGILEFYSQETLEDMTAVGGLKALKIWLQKRKLAYSEKAKQFGLKPPKGILLIGAPGTGKSLISKTTAKYMQMPLIRLDMSSIASKWYGETTNKIRQALNLACAVAPAVFWWDEVEKMLGTNVQGAHEETMRAMSTILTWMQEVKEPVFIMATCNDPKALHPALMRAGRFDEVFYVDLPNEGEREEIFRIHIAKYKRNPDDYKVKYFATLTDGYSGAEIEECIKDAMNDAYFKESELTNDYIAKAIASRVPESKSRKEEFDELKTWGTANAVNANTDISIEQTEKVQKRKAGRKIDL